MKPKRSPKNATPELTALPPCPFVAGPMIRDPRLFVGRQDTLNQLRDRMDGAQPTSVNVYGERRIGKSSLLYHFFQTWTQRVSRPNRYMVAYLTLQDARCRREGDFYAAIARALGSQPPVQNRPDLMKSLRPERWSRTAFVDMLEQWQQAGLLLTLCIDEFESLFDQGEQFDDGFFDNLRACMEQGHLMLILASHRPLIVYSRRKQLTSRFFNQGQSLRLDRFSDQEARELTRLPASTVPGAVAALSADEQETARLWGDRHPQLLQQACLCLWEARQQGRDQSRARRQFEEQARQVPGGRLNSPRLRLVRRIVWEMPRWLGELSRRMGQHWDALVEWAVGVGILLTIALVILGVINRTDLMGLIQRLLGM